MITILIIINHLQQTRIIILITLNCDIQLQIRKLQSFLLIITHDDIWPISAFYSGN